MPLISLIFLKRSPVFHSLLFSSFSFIVLLRTDMHRYVFTVLLRTDMHRYVFTHHIFLLPLAGLCNSTSCWVYLSLCLFLYTSLLSSAMYKASSYSHIASLHFFFFGMILVTAFCMVLQTSIHSSSGSLYQI